MSDDELLDLLHRERPQDLRAVTERTAVDAEEVRAALERLASQGHLSLQDEVIAKMKTGSVAMFIIFDTPEAGIGIPVSLQGFGDALANLK